MFDSLKKKISSFFKKEEEVLEKKVEEVQEEQKEEVEERPVEITEEKPKRRFLPKLTLKTKIKKAVVRKAAITDKDIESLLFDFNLALLEADVAVSVADEICAGIKKDLVGKEISTKNDVMRTTHDAIRKTLESILINPDFDFFKKVKDKETVYHTFLRPEWPWQEHDHRENIPQHEETRHILCYLCL